MNNEPAVAQRSLWRALARIACSVLGAGAFYFAWMAVFLVGRHWYGPVAIAALWLSAPVVTATGFTLGLALGERLTRVHRTPLLRLFVWPLIACAIGAAAVYWFGPMLIVFGMFAVGTAGIVLREAMASVRERTPESTT